MGKQIIPIMEFQFMEKLAKQGFSVREISKEMERKFKKPCSYNAVRGRIRTLGITTYCKRKNNKTENYAKYVDYRNKGYTLSQISSLTHMPYSTCCDYAKDYNRALKETRLSKFNDMQKEREIVEKVGFLDIETTNLAPDIGFILSYCIQDINGNTIGRTLKPSEFKGRNKVLDKNLIKECIRDMKKFDRIVGHYNTFFDIPFIRTRAHIWGLQDSFPKPREIFISDTYLIAKRKFKFHSRKLIAIAKAFNIPAKGHPLDGKEWIGALTGDKWALDYVWKHNTEDVTTTRLVYCVMKNAVAITSCSI